MRQGPLVVPMNQDEGLAGTLPQRRGLAGTLGASGLMINACIIASDARVGVPLLHKFDAQLGVILCQLLCFLTGRIKKGGFLPCGQERG